MIPNTQKVTLIQDLSQRIKDNRTEYLETSRGLKAALKECRATFLETDKHLKSQLAQVREERIATIKANKITKALKAKEWAVKREASEEKRAELAAKFLERYTAKKAAQIAKLVA
jgi:hypothetical protein